MEIKKMWQVGPVVIRAKKDGLTVNGHVIPWEEVEAARQEMTPTEYQIQVLGVAK